MKRGYVCQKTWITLHVSVNKQDEYDLFKLFSPSSHASKLVSVVSFVLTSVSPHICHSVYIFLLYGLIEGQRQGKEM